MTFTDAIFGSICAVSMAVMFVTFIRAVDATRIKIDIAQSRQDFVNALDRIKKNNDNQQNS